MKSWNVALPALGMLLFAATGLAQTGAIEGDVKAADGQPMLGAVVKVDREDIHWKKPYSVKTNKKGHYYYGGLDVHGIYKVILEVDGKDVDYVGHVHIQLGEPVPVNFDMHAAAQKQQQAAATGQLDKDQERSMSAEQKAAFEKANKERAQTMAKNKALNEAFGAGMEALKNKQYDTAVQQLAKATELDPNQHVVWANLAEAYINLAAAKTGAEQADATTKGLEAFQKALTLKPDDAGYLNNYALALAKAKKFDEAQAELAKAAQVDPPNAGKYYYNLGALLVNSGQTGPAEEFFKKAIAADPNYADAQYQYGVCLIAKAAVGADGKITPVPGTREAFEKYLQLKPDGPYATSAKAMIDSISTTLDTSYQNPAAQKKTKKK